MLAWLKTPTSDQAAHHSLLTAGIESLPLSVYATGPTKAQALVLGFTGVSSNRIPKLVERMAQALRGMS